LALKGGGAKNGGLRKYTRGGGEKRVHLEGVGKKKTRKESLGFKKRSIGKGVVIESKKPKILKGGTPDNERGEGWAGETLA